MTDPGTKAAHTSAPGKRAVVLFNLGGPDGPDDVRPFLQNLFSDRAIIDLPEIIRRPMAWLIARRRAPSAQKLYANLGGGSPLLVNTQAQAQALETELAQDKAFDTRVFIAMRYWHPFTHETAQAVAAFAPDEVILLPLYPQYSTTTSQSSFAAWNEAYDGPGTLKRICCYPLAPEWLAGQAQRIKAALDNHPSKQTRVLFSAHGLPQSVVDGRDDPYPVQIEAGAKAIASELGLDDYQVSYQSRVGPMKWLEPSTEAAIKQAADDKKGVIVVPIAFVSEHVETLVELDIEYRQLADQLGLPFYERVRPAGTDAGLILSLAQAVRAAMPGIAPYGQGCYRDFTACPYRGASNTTALGKACSAA